MKSRTLSFGELRALTFPPETHIVGDGILNKNSKLIVSASPKSYKSFTVNTMIIQLLTGGHMFGAFTNHARVRQEKFHITPVDRILLIEQELGEEDNKERLLPFWETLTPDQQQLVDDRLFIRSCDYALRLDDADGCSQMHEIIKKVSPQVVCFDPLIKFHRQNENDPSTMNVVMCNLTKMSLDLDFTSIINHHHNKTDEKSGLDMLRGASSIAGDLDTCMQLKVTNKPAAIIRIETTLKRGKPILPYHIQLNPDTLRMEFRDWARNPLEKVAGLREETVQ